MSPSMLYEQESDLFDEGPIVSVVSPGTHGFDMSKLEDAEDLIKLLLIKSGFKDPDNWSAIVAKQLHCSPETPPIKIVSATSWCVRIKVKPYPHDTSHHILNLTIPGGKNYKADEIAERLKVFEKGVSRKWRQEIKEMRQKVKLDTKEHIFRATESPVVEAIPVPEPAKILPSNEISINKWQPEKPDFFDLRKVSKDVNKLIWVFWAVEETNRSKFTHITSWKAAFNDIAGFSSFSLKALGQFLRVMEADEWIMEYQRESGRQIGYVLTQKAEQIYLPIKEKNVPAATLQKKPIGRNLLEAYGNVHHLSEILKKAAENRHNKAELDKKSQILDQEYQEILKDLTARPEQAALIEQLGQVKFG